MKLRTLLVSLALAACSAHNQPTPAAASPSPAHSADGVEMPVNRLANATVYDASGRSSACEPPEPECAPAQRDPDFLDRCRLAGFQVRRCGCRMVCAGQVSESPEFYDASGASKACAPESPDCSPPETSARFQDACEEAGHKLVVCGCEWLCNGKPQAP